MERSVMNKVFRINREKVYISGFFLSVLLIFIPSSINAAVTGECSNCHTMHNSQNAASMNLGKTIGIGSYGSDCLDCHGANRAVLLRMDCLGCHAWDINGTSNIVPNNMPQVAHSAATDLSAGNFKDVIDMGDSYGHNVHGFKEDIPTDNELFNTPPGYNSFYDPSSGGYEDTSAGQILCAGQNGCHGNRNEVSLIKANRGTHKTEHTL